MSGVEVAGFVLASLPLVISALEHYVDGVEAITRWWRYKAELSSLANSLCAENTRFLLICERLFRDLVPEDVLRLLMAHPGGAPWKDQELDNKLHQRLDFSHNVFLKVVSDMDEALKELQTKLKLDPDWKVGHCTMDQPSFVWYAAAQLMLI
jgi:hypothetical protein